MQNAVIYARYSSDRQDAASIETQLTEARARAKALNLVVVEEYCDEGKSAKTTDRPEFQRLLADAKRKPLQFDVVLVRKFDRFARNVTQSRVAKEYLKKLGVKVISVHEDVDDSPAGQFMETLVEAVAEWYSANLSAETKSGQATNTKKGFRNGGYAPYGFRNVKIQDKATGKDRTCLEIFEPEARAVRFIFDRFAQGDGYLKIINGMVERGMAPRRAKVWNKSVLVAMIDNRVYNGDLVWRKSEDEEIVAQGVVPRVVDEKTWEIVQAKRQVNRASHRPKGSTSDRPFTGLLFCRFCGSPYTVATIQGGKFKLLCASKRTKKGCTEAKYIDEGALVVAVKRKLLGEAFTLDGMVEAFARWTAEVNQDGREAQAKVKKIQAELDLIASRQGKVLEELEVGDFPRDLLKTRMASLEEKRKGLLVQLADLRQDVALVVQPNRRDLEEFCDLVRSSLVNSSGQVFRETMRRLGVQIFAGKRVEIEVSPVLMTRDTVLLGAGDPPASKTLCVMRYRFPIPEASGRAAI
jgi:site-specific DNA recombinase